VEVALKRLELLHEMVPTATVMALLINPADPALVERQPSAFLSAARALGVDLHVLNASTERDFDAVFAKLNRLRQFRDIARRENPSLVPLIDEYVALADRSDTDVRLRPTVRRSRARPMHLFDLLREKTFFPQNLDLATFASRVLPHLRTYRFDKMSRSDIAARIIEHIEESDPGTRDALELSMRDALAAMSGRPSKESERKSFLSQWEKIIKGAI
jgi:hypothetical protein